MSSQERGVISLAQEASNYRHGQVETIDKESDKGVQESKHRIYIIATDPGAYFVGFVERNGGF